jgi:hypothetical protein
MLVLAANRPEGYKFHVENPAGISVLGDDALTTNSTDLDVSLLVQAYPEVKRKVKAEIARIRGEIGNLKVKDKQYSSMKKELEYQIRELKDKKKNFREELIRKDYGNRFF